MNINQSKHGYYQFFLITFLVISVFLALLAEIQAQTKSRTSDQDAGLPVINTINSASYNLAVGLRTGGTSGLTIKYFTAHRNAIEGIIGFGPHFLSTTALLEWYHPAFAVSGLNWYYGVGAHCKYKSAQLWWYNNRYSAENRYALGVDGIVGIEYKIIPIPVALSVDLKPNIELWSNGGVGMGMDPGLGIKFTF